MPTYLQGNFCEDLLKGTENNVGVFFKYMYSKLNIFKYI